MEFYKNSSASYQPIVLLVESTFTIVINELRYPGEGNGNPLQHSCLENPMDRSAWWATSGIMNWTRQDCQEIQPVHPKRDQSWVFTGRTDGEAETPILWATWCEELTHLKRP